MDTQQQQQQQQPLGLATTAGIAPVAPLSLGGTQQSLGLDGLVNVEVREVDRSFRSFFPETDLMFGIPTPKEFVDPEGKEGKYHTISVTRRYPDASVGPCSFSGPKQKALQGMTKFDESKNKKKDDKGKPAGGNSQAQALAQQQMMMQQMMMMQQQRGGMMPGMGGYMPPSPPVSHATNPTATIKPKRDNWSIKSEFDPHNPEHVEYLEKMRQLYIAVLKHLNKESVRGVVGLNSLNLTEEDFLRMCGPCLEKPEGFGPPQTPNGSLNYPIYYPRDKAAGGRIIKGARCSTYYKVTPPGDMFQPTLFVRPGTPIRKVAFEDLQVCTFDFVPLIKLYQITINGSGPTASIQMNLEEAVVSNPVPKVAVSKMGSTIKKELDENPDAGLSFDSTIRDIMQMKKQAEDSAKAAVPQKENRPAMDEKKTTQAGSTVSGIAPIVHAPQQEQVTATNYPAGPGPFASASTYQQQQQQQQQTTPAGLPYQYATQSPFQAQQQSFLIPNNTPEIAYY
jgi:hypothetical protein